MSNRLRTGIHIELLSTLSLRLEKAETKTKTSVDDLDYDFDPAEVRSRLELFTTLH